MLADRARLRSSLWVADEHPIVSDQPALRRVAPRFPRPES